MLIRFDRVVLGYVVFVSGLGDDGVGCSFYDLLIEYGRGNEVVFDETDVRDARVRDLYVEYGCSILRVFDFVDVWFGMVFGLV